MRLILASGSKQRKDIFNMVGWKYEVVKSDIQEQSNSTEPNQYVIDLSRDKAKSVADKIKETAIIVSADTIVYMDGKIFEKPKDKKEAFENMKAMSGKITYAVTGVTIKDLYQDKEISFSDTVEVHIKQLSDEDILWYVENDKYILERAGYSLFGKGAIFIDKLVGDHNTLKGISVSKLHCKFKELGYSISDFELQED